MMSVDKLHKYEGAFDSGAGRRNGIRAALFRGGLMNARAHLFIRGRVQGVGYRAFVVHTAHALMLNGWVRNLYDRTVETVFEGERPAIETAIKRCQEGPPASIVSSIDVSWSDNAEGLSGFEVRY